MKTSNETKKEIERHYLSRFLAHPKVEVVYDRIEDCDPPDFVIHTKERRISLEMTRLYNEGLKKNDRFKEDIVNHAHKEFRQKYSEELYVLVEFNVLNFDFKSETREAHAAEVHQCVEKIFLKNRGRIFDESTSIYKEVSELIAQLHVFNNKGFDHWQPFGAYCCDHLNREWLEERVRIKESKFKNYKEKFTEKWLLLIADLGTKASSFHLGGLDGYVIDSSFDRIFLYSSMPDSLMVLK